MRRLTLMLTGLAVVGVIGGSIVGAEVAQPVELTASLSGGGPEGDPDGGGGATISVEAAAGKVCFELAWTKIRGPFAAHIHAGGAGASGDVVIPLFEMRNGTPLAGTIRAVQGCARNVDDAIIDALLADPAGHYVNVHNGRFPAGAIRGQLAGSTTKSSPPPPPPPTSSPPGSPPPYP